MLTIMEALVYDFEKNSHLKMSEIAKNLKFRAADMVKIAVFDLLKSAKIDFT